VRESEDKGPSQWAQGLRSPGYGSKYWRLRAPNSLGGGVTGIPGACSGFCCPPPGWKKHCAHGARPRARRGCLPRRRRGPDREVRRRLPRAGLGSGGNSGPSCAPNALLPPVPQPRSPYAALRHPSPHPHPQQIPSLYGFFRLIPPFPYSVLRPQPSLAYPVFPSSTFHLCLLFLAQSTCPSHPRDNPHPILVWWFLPKLGRQSLPSNSHPGALGLFAVVVDLEKHKALAAQM
jgi:hypothetical protein